MRPIIRCCPWPHGACSAYLVTFWILKHLWLQGLQIRSVGTGASLRAEVLWPFLTIWRVRRQPSGSVRVTGKPRLATLLIKRQNPCLETAGSITSDYSTLISLTRVCWELPSITPYLSAPLGSSPICPKTPPSSWHQIPLKIEWTSHRFSFRVQSYCYDLLDAKVE